MSEKRRLNGKEFDGMSGVCKELLLKMLMLLMLLLLLLLLLYMHAAPRKLLAGKFEAAAAGA